MAAGSADSGPPSWSPCLRAAPAKESACAPVRALRNAACGCRTHLSEGLAAKVAVEPGHDHGFVVLVDRGDAELLQVRKELRLRCQHALSDAAASWQPLRRRRTSSTAMTSRASNSAFVRRSCSAASSGSARHCCGRARAAPSGARRAAKGKAAGRTRRMPSWLTTSRVEYRPSRSDLTTTTFLPLPCGRGRGERTRPGD